MTVVVTCLRWLAFLASFCGWICLVSRLTGLRPAFLPAVTAATLTVTLFFFGLFHFLQPAAWILYFGGLGLLILFFVLALLRKFSFAPFLSPGVLFFAVASAAFVPILWGAHYYHYDNFSHWGTVLSEMLAFDEFPTAKTVVVFRDYAPASASFLYWFCSFVGRSEDVALMGQAMLSCAMLSSLFYRVRKVFSFRFFTTLVLALVLTCLLVFDDGTLQVYNLLVDALIGFIAVAIWFLREEYGNPLYAWIVQTPMMILLLLMKSNAVLLLFFFFLFFAYDARKNASLGRKKWAFLLPFAGAAGFYFLWKIYRDLTYGAATNSYNLQSFSERDGSFYLGLLKTLWQKISDLSQIYVSVFLLLNLLVFVALLLLRLKRRPRRALRRIWIISNGMMIGYICALMFMYAFIMATGEARHLAAFERYAVTPLILFVAMLCDGLFSALDQVLQRHPYALKMLPLCVSLLLFALIPNRAYQLISRPDFASTERGMVMDTLQQAAEIIPRNSRVAMCNGERGRRDLYYYLMMYELKTRICFDLDFRHPEYGIATDVQMLRHYDYLVISAKHYLIVSELRRAGYTVQWNKDCSVYRIKTMADGSLYIYPATMVRPN